MTFSYGLLHVDTPVLDLQQELFICQLSADTWCEFKDLLEAMNDSDE